MARIDNGDVPPIGESVYPSSGGDINAWETMVDVEEIIEKRSPSEMMATARKAFVAGKMRSVKFRKEQLKGLLKFLEGCRGYIEKAVYKDLRKHRHETNMGEIQLVENDVTHTLQELKSWAKPEKPEKRLINILDDVSIYNDPYGVVLIIGAWNYPILLTLGPLVGALAAGNTVILKPSELAPATADLLANMLTKYLDPECFQVYLGGVEETTEILKENFDYIFFTGSSAVGKIVYQAAAKNLTPVTLELGGKSPVYLDESADMEKSTRRILWGRLMNAGQTCISPDYLICTKEVQERFLQEAKKILTSFYGSDAKASPFISKIVTERHFKRLTDFIRLENVAIGGKSNPLDRIIEPTVLINVDPNDPVMREEIFGPILPIINVKTVEEAIDFINSRDKPLAFYIFAKNKRVQKMLLEQTSSGGVTVNDTITHIMTENVPFGGVGSSGMGAYHGKTGFDTFTHKKAVLVKDISSFSELSYVLRYPPYTDMKTSMINFVLKKRPGVSYSLLKNILIFVLGIACAYIFQRLYQMMNTSNASNVNS